MKLSIETKSSIPKYLQIVNFVKELIRSKKLIIGDVLPSVRQVCAENHLSQETVIKAYNELKGTGIIKSELRKGYFVASDKIDFKINVLLLFDELSEYKKILYNAIREGLDPEIAKIDIFFHHCNPELFDSLILNNINNFNIYVIMPFKDEKIRPSLARLRGLNVLFLDRKENIDEAHDNFIAQDFNDSVYKCLNSAIDLIKNYQKFILVFPSTDSVASNASKAPKEIKLGFSRFCEFNEIEYEIVDQVEEVHADEAFFVIDDLDLVAIISKGREKGFQLGKEIGLISYNDAPIKEVIAEGITVMSTDYMKLGENVVSYIVEGKKGFQQIVATELIIRNSL